MTTNKKKSGVKTTSQFNKESSVLAISKNKKEEKSFWMSYDFGLRGNYSGLFRFLDNHGAIECGNGLAYFKHKNKYKMTTIRLIESIKEEIRLNVAPLPEDRIYIIWKEESKIKGKFIFGSRKGAPWTGYGDQNTNKQIEEAL